MKMRFDPWIRYRDTGLFVVPSIHYRQVFAQLVYQACQRIPFDVIAVELPVSYQRMGMVEAVVGMLPTPGVIIEPRQEFLLREFPVDEHPDSAEREKRWVERGRMFPVSPSDSIMMAVRCPKLLAKSRPGWHPEVVCIDREASGRDPSRPRPPWIDDHEIHVHGLSAVYGRMETAWHRSRDPEVDLPREIRMAAALQSYLDRPDRRILFVCGAAHWRTIRECLDSGRVDAPPAVSNGESNGSPVRLIPAPLHPALVWFWGWLDDFPRAIWAFENACRAGRGGNFEKGRAIQRILRAAVLTARARGASPSPRGLISMKRLLRNLLAGGRCWLPELARDLFPAARACAGRTFAEIVKEEALKFPHSLPPGKDYAFFAPMGDREFAIVVGKEAFALKPDRETSPNPPLPLPLEVTEFTHRRRRHGITDGSHRGFVPEERELATRLIQRARTLAHTRQAPTVARPFSGDMGRRIAVRRTIAARAAGKKGFYVEHATRRSRRAPCECDESCPVAWVFHGDYDTRKTWCGVIRDSDGSEICHDFFLWCRSEHEVGAGSGILAHRAAYTVHLTTGKLPTRGRTRSDVERFKASYPESRRCHLSPEGDPELARLRGPEQAIACGIKYAGDHMILVSQSALKLSGDLLDYASEKGVRILRVSADGFDAGALDRLSLYHSVPWVKGKMEPPPAVYRFLPPVFG